MTRWSVDQASHPTQPYIGVDIAKGDFVADVLGTTISFAQTPQEIALFPKKLPANAVVICEATGVYERPLAAALHTVRNCSTSSLSSPIFLLHVDTVVPGLKRKPFKIS